MGLPHYAVERDSMTFQGAAADPFTCPVCCKPGRWMGWRFIPANEKTAPRCYCQTIFSAGPGAYAYDPETKTFLRRDDEEGR